MKVNTRDIEDLSEKIMLGARNAVRKMLEERARSGDSVVIGDGEEGFKYVPARELLESIKKSEEGPDK